jgi:hypothetical protein
MSAHPAPRATRSIRAETAGSSGLALGPNQRGKGGGEVEASIPVMAIFDKAGYRADPPSSGVVATHLLDRDDLVLSLSTSAEVFSDEEPSYTSTSD